MKCLERAGDERDNKSVENRKLEYKQANKSTGTTSTAERGRERMQHTTRGQGESASRRVLRVLAVKRERLKVLKAIDGAEHRARKRKLDPKSEITKARA